MTLNFLRPLFILSRQQRTVWLWTGLWLIFSICVALRSYHLAHHDWMYYSHDMRLHTHRIAYIRAYLSNPPLYLSDETTQQPLYYWLAAFWYHPGSIENADQINLAAFSFILSTLGLILLMLALRYISSWFIRYVVLIYVGITPAFVLASCSVGNDALVTFIGLYFFYSLLRLNRHPLKVANFWITLGLFIAGLFTKLNLLALAASLPFLFWRTSSRWLFNPQNFSRALILLAALIFWLGLTLWHNWSPGDHRFVFYRIRLFENQVIPTTDLTYFLNWNLRDIFLAGQATTILSTPDSVRFSFFNFIYANMFFGEYEYTWHPLLALGTRLILFFGTIIPFGLILALWPTLFGWPLTKTVKFNPFLKTAFLLICAGLALQMHYVSVYPVVCCADFRFQFGLIAWIGYYAGRGLYSFPRSNALKITSGIFLAGYFFSSLWLLIINYAVR